MPTEAEHTRQWQSNRQALEQLRAQDEFPDWIITVAFYTALHSLERFLARHDVHPRDHRRRAALLLQFETDLTRLFLNRYKDLENASRVARYDCRPPSDEDAHEQLQHLALIEERLALLVP